MYVRFMSASKGSKGILVQPAWQWVHPSIQPRSQTSERTRNLNEMIIVKLGHQSGPQNIPQPSAHKRKRSSRENQAVYASNVLAAHGMIAAMAVLALMTSETYQ